MSDPEDQDKVQRMAADPYVIEVFEDPRFRIYGFSRSDLRNLRHILSVLDADVVGLATRVGVKLP